ncbi:CRISPR-associated protein, Cse2 family [uncultured Desulfobacterium sp.]|uniref:CRISPR-associated protein, Cse2 family n=1 Tax=uncultured Desulfobacterium sp. TaxID=201089 RepID=A0A445MSE4_9BACT|nr:CRISPR-associated protein, Cse2 family [uncultured Desulfobacterium sp.]
MSSFVKWLEGLNEKDSKVRTVLRRSLTFDPGMFVPAYPYVEPFVKDEESSWRREMYYLVAGLWAAHWREDRSGTLLPIGKACAVFDAEKRQKTSQDDRRNMSSTERRFVTLIDSDRNQLPHRLRQLLALLKEQTIDFDELLKGLLHWNDGLKRTQNAWARDFYRYMNPETETTNQEESK